MKSLSDLEAKKYIRQKNAGKLPWESDNEREKVDSQSANTGSGFDRKQMASMMMQGIISNSENSGMSYSEMARRAVRAADALLDELSNSTN